jgi:uncharacterized protein YdhG (YjbR/CyaY superfamily)
MKPKTIDEYIAAFPPQTQAILQKIRTTVHATVPDAVERISYRMPSFTFNGSLVYFAAFNSHIGFYPPVRGDAKLMRDISVYAGEKGNLRFPFDKPIPYALIRRIVKARQKENQKRAGVRRKNVQ